MDAKSAYKDVQGGREAIPVHHVFVAMPMDPGEPTAPRPIRLVRTPRVVEPIRYDPGSPETSARSPTNRAANSFATAPSDAPT